MPKQTNLELLKLAIKPMVFLTTMILIISNLTKVTLWSVTFTLLLVMMFFDFWETLVTNSKKYLKSILIFLALGLIIRRLGAYGVVGFIAIVLFLAAYKIFRSWDLFMGTMRSLESLIWGRELDSPKEVKGCVVNEETEEEETLH